MHEQNKAIVKALVPVAWADGEFADQEREVFEALLEAFESTPEEADELRAYANTPKTVDDIPVSDLSYDDRRVLLQHAVLLSHVDGNPSEPEVRLIDAMVEKLRIPAQEATELRQAATVRALQHIQDAVDR